ncbi:hypothetical protein [Amycolatopsis sp. NPDC059657]|uniref:hypothetical protein n=1 Tax=Amycolatopsis sp. NPDC059657 TaxID=3346899 RepID=UPI00366BD94D
MTAQNFGAPVGLDIGDTKTHLLATVDSEVFLPSQHACLHEIPDDHERLDKMLAEAARTALTHQQPDGNFEDPGADDDIGDMGLGVVSLLCLAWHREPERVEPDSVRRGLDFFLRHRVFRTDNPGEPFLRLRHSGLPYARYLPGEGEHPFGDWPSTVWALLHAVNVLELGRGLLTTVQYAELTKVAVGYWHWLTEASLFNPQQTANQAIGAVAAGLMLGDRLCALSRTREGRDLSAAAMRWYTDVIRPARVFDRGFALPVEHGGGHDQNYLPISLSFLAQAHRVTGDRLFLEDGIEIARHLECRLSARGFDYGGPRYSEQHVGAEGMLGLRYFSGRIQADLGRYLGDRRVTYYPAAATGAPSGHFAFTTVWLCQDDTEWFRGDEKPVITTHSLRGTSASISFTSAFTPYLIDAAGTAVIESVADRQHGIGPLLEYADGTSLLLTRPLGPTRTRDARAGGLVAKLVTKAVVTREQSMLSVQQLAVCDGQRITLVTVVPRAALPADARLSLLAGLPYAEADGERQRRIRTVAAPSGMPFDLDVPYAALDTGGALLAGSLLISSGSGMRVINPAPGATHFTTGLTQEEMAFSLADDPRGYGNPDSGWQRVTETNRLLADPLPGTPPEVAVFAVRYGPPADGPFRAAVNATPGRLLVSTDEFSALIGDPAGDANGEPFLRLRVPHTTRPDRQPPKLTTRRPSAAKDHFSAPE